MKLTQAIVLDGNEWETILHAVEHYQTSVRHGFVEGDLPTIKTCLALLYAVEPGLRYCVHCGIDPAVKRKRTLCIACYAYVKRKQFLPPANILQRRARHRQGMLISEW